MKKNLVVVILMFAFFWTMPDAFAQGNPLKNCAGLAGVGAAIGGLFGGAKGAAIGSSGGCGTGLLIDTVKTRKRTQKIAEQRDSEKGQVAEREIISTATNLSGQYVALRFGISGDYNNAIAQIILDHALHALSGLGATILANAGSGNGYNNDPCQIPNRRVVCLNFGQAVSFNGQYAGGNVYIQPGASNVAIGSSGSNQPYAVPVIVSLYDNSNLTIGPGGQTMPMITYLASLVAVSNAKYGSEYLNTNIQGRVGYQSYGSQYNDPQLAYIAATRYAIDELTEGNGWLKTAAAQLANAKQ